MGGGKTFSNGGPVLPRRLVPCAIDARIDAAGAHTGEVVLRGGVTTNPAAAFASTTHLRPSILLEPRLAELEHYAVLPPKGVRGDVAVGHHRRVGGAVEAREIKFTLGAQARRGVHTAGVCRGEDRKAEGEHAWAGVQ